VRIALLGPLEIRADDGTPVEVGGARLRTLLILLALEAGQVVPTARLVDGVWGESPPAAAANALQALVSRLRRSVPVESRPAGYRLDIEPDAVDAYAFERLVHKGRAASGDDPAGAAATLRAALNLWRGPALAEVAEADFARAPAARLTELRLRAVEDRIEADLRLGGGPALVAELAELVAAHPLREPFVGLLMRALAAAGRPGAALHVYETARGRLADELGADPSPALAALHLDLLRGESPAGTAPAIQPVTDPAIEPPTDLATESAKGPGARPATEPGRPASRTNLRAELTSFVGRTDEVERVGKLVRESRLTTLVGPGGAGKTRLAVESARGLVDEMPDGVWMVHLAPIQDAAELAPAALAALGFPEYVRSTLWTVVADHSGQPVDRLAQALTGKRLLLVLDNCEHLVEAAAALADQILGQCPGLHILATSREPLGITGETLWTVEPLALPPPATDAATALEYASVRLLADRAHAVRPGFAVDDTNAAAIVAICRALDGMPLAIELAAARLRALTPEQLAVRLGDRFRLLTAGSRTALPRHQTLRAVVDWSWDLLDEAERALWRRLAVFSGGITIEAAERVCAGGPVPADAVVDVLAALVDKSLITAGEGTAGEGTAGEGTAREGTARGDIGGTEPRYRMLETIRAYGLERLAEAGEREALRRAHAAYFLDLAETADPYLRRAGQIGWLARLSADHDNLHAALRGAIAAGDARTAVRFAGALGWYWSLRGHRAEGVELAVQALAVPGEVPAHQRATAAALGIVNSFDRPSGAPEHALFRTVLRAADGQDLDHPFARLADVLQSLTWNPVNGAALNVLPPHFDDPDPWIGAAARLMYAMLAVNMGAGFDHAEMESHGRVALANFQAVGDRWGVALSLGGMAELAALRGDHATAVACYAEALAASAELGTYENVAQFQARYAHQLWLLGERERAKGVLAEAGRTADRLGLPELRAVVQYGLGELARMEGDAQRARALLTDAARHATSPTVSPQFRAISEAALGNLAADAGDLATARAHHRTAVTAALSSADAPVIAHVLAAVAGFALRCAAGAPGPEQARRRAAQRAAERAAELLGAGDAIRGTRDLSLVDAVNVESAARAALGEPEFTEAYQRGRRTTVDTAQALAEVTLGA
jgi:predicted ATPase/DNA-binding SARP family transcriptional activator